MNLSSASVYDNVNTSSKDFSNSRVYRTINDLLTINSDVQIKIFCPLCVYSFDYKFSLFEHLRTVHSNFITEVGDKSLKFKECPFCNAKFYGKHLTARHALIHHSKPIGELFVEKKYKSPRCLFCSRNFEKDYMTIVKHLEEMHFMDYEEEFKRKFSCDNIFQMTFSELINSEIQNRKSQFMTNDTKNELFNDLPDCEEASKINCYDFSDLKQQLEFIGNWKKSPNINQQITQTKRSILKDVKNSGLTPSKPVRRVLRFDLPDYDEEDKENLVLKENLNTFKKINIDEHSLLCHNNKNEFDRYFNLANDNSDNWCGEPKHSSTPNRLSRSSCKILVRDDSKKIKSEFKQPSFKSLHCQKNVKEFEFQCGKCQELFAENLDLVCHVKKNHKKFSFKALQPCYRCAICNARFFKNYYLKKHHSLHKPY